MDRHGLAREGAVKYDRNPRFARAGMCASLAAIVPASLLSATWQWSGGDAFFGYDVRLWPLLNWELQTGSSGHLVGTFDAGPDKKMDMRDRVEAAYRRTSSS
jgi:hypothetical protein